MTKSAVTICLIIFVALPIAYTSAESRIYSGKMGNMIAGRLRPETTMYMRSGSSDDTPAPPTFAIPVKNDGGKPIGRRVRLGFLVGGSFSRVREYADLPGLVIFDLNNEVRTTFTIGVFAECAMGRRLAICPGVQYVKKGGLMAPSKYNNQSIRPFLKTDYLAFPILSKLVLSRLNRWYRMAAILGPEFAFKLHEESIWQEKDFSAAEKQIGSYDLGLILGYELSVKLGGGYLAYNLRFILGLKNVGKTNAIMRNGDRAAIYNSDVIVGISYCK